MAEEQSLCEIYVDNLLPDGKQKIKAKFYLRNFIVRDHLKNKLSVKNDIKMDRREVDFGAGEKTILNIVNT
jgi:hypothetical protein